MSDNLGSLESFQQLKLEKSCTPMRLPPLYTTYAKVSMPAIRNVKQKLLERVTRSVRLIHFINGNYSAASEDFNNQD